MNKQIQKTIIIGGLLLAHPLLSNAQPRVALDGPAQYTAEQAERGEAAYMQNCVACHGQNLNDGQFGLPLVGAPFADQWAGVAARDLFVRLRDTMPPASAGQLSNQTYSDLVAFLLQRNDVPVSDVALPASEQELASLYIPGRVNSLQATMRTRGFPAGVTLPEWPQNPDLLSRLSDVTDELLFNPPDGSWLTWRRTYDDMGFSPLDQINRDNVDELRVAWGLTLPGGPNESTPLIHEGVMFIHSFGDNIMALNAVTGEELWHYRRDLPEDVNPSVKRNIALYGDNVYAGTSDGMVVAVNMRTGRMEWETPIGGDITGGPLVARGVVMQGTRSDEPGGGFIQALDAETGELMWRFNSIPKPEEFGGNTWNNLPYEERSGGTVWTAGSYDPELNLAYFGPAPTYLTGPLTIPVEMPGVNNDALYTNSTLALVPETGELAWHFQHMPNDPFDMDWAFERIILDLEVDGEPRRVSLTANKMGFHDVNDAATGEYLFSYDMDLQNFILGVDPETKRKIVDTSLIPPVSGETRLVCPHAGGGRSWLPAAYNPESGRLFIPAVETCMDASVSEAGRTTWVLRPPPDSDGLFGHIQAVNIDETMEEAWTARQRAPQSTGILATAGGLVFAASIDRNVSAYDEETGEKLWTVRLNDVPNSNPISYEVDGKQYIAVVVGYGGAQVASFPRLTPEITLPVARSSSVWVFELPSD